MSHVKEFLLRYPNLLFWLKPFVHAAKEFLGPPPHACLSCFRDIRGITDAEVARFLSDLSHQPEVRFVQIGSSDGKTGDPVYELVSKNKHWKGVLVEPVDFLHRKLKENYSNRRDRVFENVLISKHSGEAQFYYLDDQAAKEFPDLPFWHDQLGSFSQRHIIAHLGERVRPFIRKEKIETITLPELLQRNEITALDLLHIDAEGHD